MIFVIPKPGWWVPKRHGSWLDDSGEWVADCRYYRDLAVAGIVTITDAAE